MEPQIPEWGAGGSLGRQSPSPSKHTSQGPRPQGKQFHGEDQEGSVFMETKQVDSNASPGSREMRGVRPSTEGMDGSFGKELSAPHDPGRMESEEKGKGREPKSCSLCLHYL